MLAAAAKETQLLEANLQLRERLAKVEEERDIFHNRAINAEEQLEKTSRELQEATSMFDDNQYTEVPGSLVLFGFPKPQKTNAGTDEEEKRKARLAEKDQRLKLELEAKLEEKRKARLAEKDQKLKLELEKRRNEQRNARCQLKH